MEQADEVENDPYEDYLQDPGKEAFDRLFEAEADFMVPLTYFRDNAKFASRIAAVQIIEMIYPIRSRRFDPLIAYTALTYFDRFYSRNDDFPSVVRETAGDSSNIMLFVICCLTIAWKLRENSFRLTNFMREKNIPYSVDNVREMELQICRGLNWRMRTVTPFLFVGFFVQYLKFPLARSCVHDLIYIAQRDIAFTQYRPSVIAMSAMLAISSGMVPTERITYLLLMLTREIKLLKPLEKMIEESMKRLGPLYWSAGEPLAARNDQNEIQQLEAEGDPNEEEQRSCGTSITQKLPDCCTSTCNAAITVIYDNIKDACNVL